MLDITQIVKTVNSIITKNSDLFRNSIVTFEEYKPTYNHNLKGVPLVCKMNFSVCKGFYKGISQSKSIEKVCPFGFTICKKTYDISTRYNKISIFSIIDYSTDSSNYNELNSLPRELKKNKETILDELKNFKIDRQASYDNFIYFDELIETLLIGRIGVAIQGLSHQFFTPLQGAMSDLQNISNNTDLKSSISRLEKNFNNLSKLATEVQLLLASSEEFNCNMLRRVTVHNMVADIFESLESTAKHKHIKLVQGYNEQTKTVHAIPGQLYIVLSNIISNAVKYSYRGFPEALLDVGVNYSDLDNAFLKIKITNEGCKITNKEIDDRLIFDLGYRGVHSGDRQRKGTGTGLYIADEITRVHKGEIKVISEIIGGRKYEGTDRYLNTFTIIWPYFIDC